MLKSKTQVKERQHKHWPDDAGPWGSSLGDWVQPSKAEPLKCLKQGMAWLGVHFRKKTNFRGENRLEQAKMKDKVNTGSCCRNLNKS